MSELMEAEKNQMHKVQFSVLLIKLKCTKKEKGADNRAKSKTSGHFKMKKQNSNTDFSKI